MFPRIQNPLDILPIGGLIYLCLFGWDAIARTPQTTETGAIAEEKALEAKRKKMFEQYSREAAKDAAERRVEEAKQKIKEAAQLQQRLKNGRKGCWDEQSDAYLQLPLRIVDPVFQPCAVSLLRNTKIPVILPPNATKIHQYSSGSVELYAYLDFTTTGYSIGLTRDPLNHYQLQTASYAAEIITEKLPILKNYYEERIAMRVGTFSFEAQRREAGTITLINGLQGYYFPPLCGANCHGAYGEIVWDQNGYRYSVAIKMGRKEEVLQIVNEAIENQL
jgi:hypothetical protein